MIRNTIPAEELLRRASAIGQYYGFTPLSTITAAARGSAQPKDDHPDTLSQFSSQFSLDPIAETIANFLKQCKKAACAPSQKQPLFIWHSNLTHGRPAKKKAIIQFHALGSDRAIADTVVIRAIHALVRDLFDEEPTVRINSMGDKETRARYTRELNNFFRKNAHVLPEECAIKARQDIHSAAEFVLEHKLIDNVPAPTEHLSDASRKRFEDLLEYLEMTETPYELSRHLISKSLLWNDTCFDISVGGNRVAWGSRYHDLGRHIFPGAPFSATGAVIQIASAGGNIMEKPKEKKLHFSFVHIGDEAKRLSINLADDFMKAGIPLTQDIGVESLSEQLYLAEKRNSPYLLLLGRKEALEKSVILRNRQTQVETTFPLAGLTERLKTFI